MERPFTEDAWWYNHRSGEVEYGRKSPAIYRDGPYASKEEAERAPEIWRERSKAWDDEEKSGD
jgi:hypothetical protein